MNEKSTGSMEDLELCEMLLNKGYSLNAVDHYGDNLLHVCAANGCVAAVKTILSQNNSSYVDRKNKFGWTPLMHAIRANEPEMVEALLENGADPAQRNYLGVSTLSLAAGVSLEMFEIVRNACPSILKNSANDDVTPLCVAAVKNDKELFFRILDLGLGVKDESTYAHLAMEHSTIPEIRSLANPLQEIREYWNDRSDDIPIRGNEDRNDLPSPMENYDSEAKNSLPMIFFTPSSEAGLPSCGEEPTNFKFSNFDQLFLKKLHLKEIQPISPNLIYNRDTWFAGSPNLSCSTNHFQPHGANEIDDETLACQKQHRDNERMKKTSQPMTPQRTSKIESQTTDHDISLSFAPEFSPSRSPCLPSDFQDVEVCGEDTPTPPHYKTPPQGMVLNSDQAKLIVTLRQFDLEHHIPRFLAEEVDMSLFLTLNDRDLTEIGIPDERDRQALLEVIDALTKSENR